MSKFSYPIWLLMKGKKTLENSPLIRKFQGKPRKEHIAELTEAIEILKERNYG